MFEKFLEYSNRQLTSIPNNLKLANVTSGLKKEDSNLIKNYRPGSVLPVVSKIFEKQLQKQIISYIINQS